MAAMRSVAITIALLVLIMYVFSIIFRQLTDGTNSGELYFRTIQDSMYTLLVTGTFLDDLNTVVASLGQDSFVYAGVFLVFVFMGALTVMNMLIGVLCDVVSGVARVENEEMTVGFVNRKLTRIVEELDIDGDAETITKDEFNDIMGNREAVLTLREVGVDPEGLIDYADHIFQGQEDENQDRRLNGEQEELVSLSLEDFISTVLQFRGSNTATVKDMVDLRKFITKILQQFEKNFRLVQSAVDEFMQHKDGKPSPEGPRADLQLGLARLEAYLSTMRSEVEANSNLNGYFFDDTPPVPGRAEDFRVCSERLDEFSGLALGELDKLRLLLPMELPNFKAEKAGKQSGNQEKKLLHSRLRRCLAELEEFLLTTLSSSVREFTQSLAAIEEPTPIRSGPLPFEAHLATKLKDLSSQFYRMRRSL